MRAFFLRRFSAENGLTLPELFEESRRSRVVSTKSERALIALGAQTHDVDARLLSRYFDDFVRRGIVPRVGRSGGLTRPATEAPPLVGGEPLSDWLGQPVQVGSVSVSPVATDESIVAELTAWRSSANTRAGLFHGSIEAIGEEGAQRSIRLFVKA